ncbi:MAG: RNA polymerase sigma factor [Deltaproteobacteria bacterium]|nr:RNA polymerase sigma factor [Deltaproteobacteria bacterium]
MNSTTSADVRLLRAWAAGDRNAGEALYDRYFDIVYRFFRCKVPDATADLTQATMEALIRSNHRFEGQGSFRSFVLGIAVNVLRNHLRSRGRSRIDFVGNDDSCEELGLGPFELVADDQDQKLLVKALRRIPIELQIVIELHYWEEMSSREIGVVLQAPASTIRARRQRAKVLLRRQLERMMSGPERVETTLVGLATWAEELRQRIGIPSSSTAEHGPRA